MKPITINIPFTNELIIYTGHKNRGSFNSLMKKHNPRWIDDTLDDGMQCKNLMYIEDIGNKEVLYHELAHYLEWLYGHLSCQDEPEFKACLMAHVMVEIDKELLPCPTPMAI